MFDSKDGKPNIPVAKDKPNPYLRYHAARAGSDVPETPLVAYESSLFGYYAYKYAAPAMLLTIYLLITAQHLTLRDAEFFTWFFAFASPVQIAAIVLCILNVALTLPLSHIIVAEDGLFVRSHAGREFVEWKYLRSYHISKYSQPWLIHVAYYRNRGRIRRFYVITSQETAHTTVEMLNYIRRVHRETEKPEQQAELEHTFA